MQKLYRKIERRGADLDPHFRGLGKVLWDVRLSLRPDDVRDFRLRSWVWAPVRPKLLEESHNKCGYCESPLQTDSPRSLAAEVDHIRPKSKYRWLAFDYLNYIACCPPCNRRKGASYGLDGQKLASPSLQVRKSGLSKTRLALKGHALELDKWSGKSKGLLGRFNQVLRMQRRLHRREAPLLLNPYLDRPRRYFSYRLGTDKGDPVVLIEPKSRKPSILGKALYTIEVLELNRYDLARDRWLTLRPFHRDILKYDKRYSRYRRNRLIRLRQKGNFSRKDQPFLAMFEYFAAHPDGLIGPPSY